MKKSILFLLFSLSTFAHAEPQPPANPVRADYVKWLQSHGGTISPFSDYVFDWYEAQVGAPLPKEVAADPEKLFVSVEKPLAETIELEDNGDIEAGVTYGLETYAIIDAPVSMVLETIMFKWGKPVGQREGTTYPLDTVYSYRQESIKERWNSNAWETTTTKTGGGFAKDQHDVFSLVAFGDAQKGYVLLGNFTKNHGFTTTTSSFSIMTLTPTADGKTDYRVSGRHMGQSYTFLGIGYGRKNFWI